jgi:hypothetical protein
MNDEVKIVPGSDFRDRRRHRRDEVAILGRLALPDGSECDCVTIDISPTSIALQTSKAVAVGDRVVIDLDEIGCFDGAVMRILEDRMVLSLTLDTKRKERLGRRIEIFRSILAREALQQQINFFAVNGKTQQNRKSLEIVVKHLVLEHAKG